MGIFNLIAPVFLLIAAGFFLDRGRLLPEGWVRLLNLFVYRVSLPALILGSFWQGNWMSREVGVLVGANLFILFLLSALLLAVLDHARLSDRARASVFLSASVGNTVYMGFPIAFGVSGQVAAAAAIGAVQLVGGLVFSLFAADYLVVRSRKLSSYAKDLFFNPLMLSLAAGLILGATGTGRAAFFPLSRFVDLLAVTASPLALLALGGFLHGRFHPRHAWLAAVSAGAKLLIWPLLLWLLMDMFGLSGGGASLSALMAAMPTAATAFVVAEKYRLDESLVASVIVLSTAFSMLTLPAMLAALF